MAIIYIIQLYTILYYTIDSYKKNNKFILN